MKIKALLSILVIFVFTACAAPPEPSPAAPFPSLTASTTPTRTPKPAPTRYPTWTPRPPLPTRTPEPTSTFPSPITANPPVVWGELGSPLWLLNTSIWWSPTANEVLSSRYTGEEKGDTGLAAPPDFQIKTMFFQETGFTGSFTTWSPDGEWLLFQGPDEYIDYQYLDLSDLSILWAVNRTGDNLHKVRGYQDAARWLKIEGWVDRTTFVTSEYMGGGHRMIQIVNLLNDEVLESVLIYGVVFRPNSAYVAAAEAPYDHYRMIAVPRTPGSGAANSDNMRAYPCGEACDENRTFFKDWQPGANRMLVQLYTYDFNTDAFITSELWLWDLDTCHSQLIVAGAVDGGFSPDGEILAFTTLGPIPLDGSRKLLQVSPEVSPDLPPYLHLMHFSSRQVFLSLPIQGSYTTDYITDIFETDLSFSPSSRLLAFYTPAAVRTNLAGWPLDADLASEEGSYLNILDLETKQLVVSSLRAHDTRSFRKNYWSPNRNVFVYQDHNANWILFNTGSGDRLPLTLNGGEQLVAPSWSFDGQYLSLNTFHGTEYGWPVWSSAAIWQVPQP